MDSRKVLNKKDKKDKKKDKDGKDGDKEDEKEKEDPAEADNLVLEEIDIENITALPEALKKNFEKVMADVRKSLEDSLIQVEKDVN